MPVINFTVKALDSLKPSPSETSKEYWDENTPGFGLRISYQGRKVWIVRFKVRGTQEMDRVTLSSYEAMSLVEARIAAREYLDSASRGNNLKKIKTQQQKAEQENRLIEERRLQEEKNFEWLSAQYIELHAKRYKRSWQEDQRILNREVVSFWDNSNEGWRNRPIQDVSRKDVSALLENTLRRTQQPNEKGIGGKGVHANRVFSLIRKVFNFALEKGWLEKNPCEGLARPLKHEESRDLVLRLDGIRDIWNLLDKETLRDGRTKYTTAIFKLMLLTGQRGGEVRLMEWEEVDFEYQTWTIPKSKTKNEQSQTVPLSSQAIEILASFLPDREKSPWVFPNPKNKTKPMRSYQKAIQRVRKGTRIQYVGHDLRRTASSHMASIGIQPHIIKKILNHSEKQDITHIYNRYSYEKEKRQALQQWGDYLVQIVTLRDRQSASKEDQSIALEQNSGQSEHHSLLKQDSLLLTSVA